MRYMMFEDKNTSEISIKLREWYRADDTDILFTDSNNRIKGRLKDFIGKPDNIMVCLDMPVDNENVSGVLVTAQKTITKYQLNAIIVPIPSIEYYVCKLYKLDLTGWLLSHEKYYAEVSKTFRKSYCTFETYTKYLYNKFCSLDKVSAESIITALPMFYGNCKTGDIGVSPTYEYYISLYDNLKNVVTDYVEHGVIKEGAGIKYIKRIDEFMALFEKRWR